MYAGDAHAQSMTTATALSRKNIYFARHGERIDWIDKAWIKSAERRVDPPLSPYGLQQAHELGIFVGTLQPRITHIYSSPFLRTLQTAVQVAHQINKDISSTAARTKIRIEPGFGEYFLNDGIWSNENIYRSLNQLSELSADTDYFDHDYQSVFNDDYFLKSKTENQQQLRDRLKQALQSILDAHTSDCNILIVTHAAPLIEGVRALLTPNADRTERVIKKEDIEISTNCPITWDMTPVRAGVCSLTHLELTDDRWTLLKNGHVSYLSKGEQDIWWFRDDGSLYATS